MNIGRYRVVKEIGRGSMGVVYQAEDPNLDLLVALKVLRQDRLANEAFVRRFLSEAKALGRLDHPNIVRVFNVDRDGDTVYIAMEFIEGESLASRMKRQAFSPEALAEFGATVAEALDSAHRSGIVHRDVKPSNILVKSDGRFKITDFGIAHIDDPCAPEQTQAGEILGTPAYMSPEQVLGRPVDGRSDLFSLGIILYELATGTRPFGGEGIHAIFTAIAQETPPRSRLETPISPRPFPM
ncbi:MAG: serine/threonine protein kinase [Geobacteraceae bacterium]|nr:serine/threonine protein kinase [Geobacteraceae bacterium]